MLAPRYLAGESFLGRRDPRLLILVPLCTLAVVAQVRDARLMAVALLVTLTYYASARIPVREIWANWVVVLVFVFFVAAVNGIIVGEQRYAGSAGKLFVLPVIGVAVSTASLSYALTLLLRALALASSGFPLAFAIRPGDLAVALARLGVPGRFAYAVDLTFRLLPTISVNVRETAAAQRLRGYEPPRTRNPVRRIAGVRPLIIPVTIAAFVEAEDVADALDLRGFGAGRRTWLRTLHFDLLDVIVLTSAVVAVIGTTVVSVSGFMPGLWTW